MTRTVAAPGRWIRFPWRRPPSAAVRLFCLPYAGGSAMAFRDWIQASDTGVEVAAVQLPGRGDRCDEPPCERFAPLVARLRDELAPHLDRPYALYGHSFGGHLGLALARTLRPAPVALFVGACTPPSVYRSQPPEPVEDDAALLAWLRGLGGTPDAVLDDPHLRGLVLPPLRGDLRVLADSRRLRPGAPADHPIHAFAGSADPVAPPSAMGAWAAETRGVFTCETVPGSHLFLAESGAAVLARILERISPPPSPQLPS